MTLLPDYSEDYVPRLKQAFWIIVVALLVIWLRIYFLQIIKGDYYRLFSEENSIRSETIPALRGMMMDRNGAVLVDNRPAFDIVLIPQFVVDAKSVLDTLEKDFGFSKDFLEKKWALRSTQPKYLPIVLEKDVSLDRVSRLRSRKSPWGPLVLGEDLRGVEAHVRYEREYPEGAVATHVLGYIREIDSAKLEQYENERPGLYKMGDAIGVRGLEEVWDLPLRGRDGYVERVVNAMGREVVAGGFASELLQKEPEHGFHLKLTLDARLQKVAHDAFVANGKGGAAVALDPDTGAVLLLYSAPSYDLNRLGASEGSDYYKQIVNAPQKYLLNRAIQGAYPPGSTFKVVMATASLAEKKVRLDEQLYCPGYLTFGNRTFRCWKDGGHGAVNFLRSLVESCDVYYYQMGNRLGVDTIARYARAFGLGSVTGIGLQGERSGLIPTEKWKEKTYHDEWHPGETLSVAIGQGYDLVTPLQAAQMIAFVANGGKQIRPYLVAGQVNPVTGQVTPEKQTPPSPASDAAEIPLAVLEKVKEALVGVVSSEAGTAHRLAALQIPMGGKTGTAQVVRLDNGCRGGACEDHAWFVAFAPAEHPKIAIAVLVEHGGHGSTAAAPIVGEIIKTYLKGT